MLAVVRRVACVLSAAGVIALWLTPPAHAEVVRVASAWPRGFYDRAVFGRAEAPLPLGPQVKNVAAAVEVYGASRDGVNSTSLAAYVMLRHYAFPKAVASPFVAVGAGLHAIRSRRTIEGIGTLSGTESSVKGHFWAGVRGPSIEGARPFLETRWTAPSKYVFDYVAVGIGF